VPSVERLATARSDRQGAFDLRRQKSELLQLEDRCPYLPPVATELWSAGVCIPSGDAERMAEELLTLSWHEERRKETGSKGRETVTRMYSRVAKARDALKCMEAVLRQAEARRNPA
jgi:hypothetical protein